MDDGSGPPVDMKESFSVSRFFFRIPAVLGVILAFGLDRFNRLYPEP